MFDKMDKLYLDARTRGKQLVQDFREEERGASDIVAIIAIIVIVLAVAVIFREQITSVVKSAFKNVTDWINSGTKDGAGN